MPEIRQHLLQTPHTGIRRMLELAQEVTNPYMLISGDPNFGTPAHIVAAAADASFAGRTGYAPAQGMPELREALASKVRARNFIDATAEQVCVTTGACGALFTSLMLLVDPGDEVLVPDPGWSNYAAMLHVLGTQGVPYSAGCGADEPFLDVDQIAGLVTPRTKVILINSPANPTGRVADRRTLTDLLAVAERHDLWIISDEAYDEIVFDDRGCSIAALGGLDRVISIFSFSKTYAMTGWRLGYATGPERFIRHLSLHQEPVVSSAPTISQHAALAALAGEQDCVATMTQAYRRRRDLAAKILSEQDIGFVWPEGAFFIMVDISATGLDSWTFAERLLVDHAVGVVPGLAFGQRGEGYARVSLAAADDVLDEGLRRLAAMTADLAASVDR